MHGISFPISIFNNNSKVMGRSCVWVCAWALSVFLLSHGAHVKEWQKEWAFTGCRMRFRMRRHLSSFRLYSISDRFNTENEVPFTPHSHIRVLSFHYHVYICVQVIWCSPSAFLADMCPCPCPCARLRVRFYKRRIECWCCCVRYIRHDSSPEIIRPAWSSDPMV